MRLIYKATDGHGDISCGWFEAGEVCLCSKAAGKSDLEGIVRFRPAGRLRTPEKRCPASIPAAVPPATVPTP